MQADLSKQVMRTHPPDPLVSTVLAAAILLMFSSVSKAWYAPCGEMRIERITIDEHIGQGLFGVIPDVGAYDGEGPIQRWFDLNKLQGQLTATCVVQGSLLHKEVFGIQHGTSECQFDTRTGEFLCR